MLKWGCFKYLHGLKKLMFSNNLQTWFGKHSCSFNFSHDLLNWFYNPCLLLNFLFHFLLLRFRKSETWWYKSITMYLSSVNLLLFFQCCACWLLAFSRSLKTRTAWYITNNRAVYDDSIKILIAKLKCCIYHEN